MNHVDNVAELRNILQLTPTEPIRASQESEFFVGQSQFKPDGRVFGGQVLAQCVMAAGATVAGQRPIRLGNGLYNARTFY